MVSKEPESFSIYAQAEFGRILQDIAVEFKIQYSLQLTVHIY
jgi:hypothetical protein